VNRLVIFGERPGPNTDPNRPLHIHTTTGAAARLRELLQLDTARYYETSRYNVVNDKTTSTADFQVRSRVALLMQQHRNAFLGVRFIFCGKAAINAAPPQYRRLEFGHCLGDVMLIPHPSGVNRYWNSEANTRFIVEALRQFTRGI
jgi:hypothetical protein